MEENFFGNTIDITMLNMQINIKNISKTTSKDNTNKIFLLILILSPRDNNMNLTAGLKENPKTMEPAVMENNIPRFNSFAL